MLFLLDPSIRPDNLLNIVKYLDPQSELNKKSTVDEFIDFIQSKFSSINKID